MLRLPWRMLAVAVLVVGLPLWGECVTPPPLTPRKLLGNPDPQCQLTLQQAEAVGYGEMLTFPGLWNGEGCTVVSVDRKNGNILLYPQLKPGSVFVNMADNNRSTRLGAEKEAFMMFSQDGHLLWSATAYSTTLPVVDGDVFVLNEREVYRLAQEDGRTLWRVPLCEPYRAGSTHGASAVFPVSIVDDSGEELVVGLLLSPNSECGLSVPTDSGFRSIVNLTSNALPSASARHTPFLVHLSKASGKVLKYTAFHPVSANWMRHAVSNGPVTTFLGMRLDSDSTVLSVTQFSGRVQDWGVTLTTPHPHNYLMAQSFADFSQSDDVLFIADPTGEIQVFGTAFPPYTKKHSGLLFGAISRAGQISWTRAVAYSGVITSTFVAFMEGSGGVKAGDPPLVVLGAVWDGQQDLVLGPELTMPRMRRPAQGLLGLLLVYDRTKDRFLLAQEVAPEVAYPGLHLGLSKVGKDSFQVVSAPAFWDNAPRRLVDNAHSVALPKPEMDSVVLLRWLYRPCRDQSSSSVPHLHPSRGSGGRWLRTVMLVLFTAVLLGGLGATAVMLLKRQGYVVPLPTIPPFWSRITGAFSADYHPLRHAVDDDDDAFEDQNRPI